MENRFNDKFQLFSKNGLGSVRTLISDQGDIWFAGADICDCLGLNNPSMAYKRLNGAEKMTLNSIEGHSGKRGGAQNLVVISESGMYSLIMTSRRKEAIEFQRWITGEVLPSIRKNGGYVYGQEDLNAHDRQMIEKQVRELSQKVVFLQKELAAKDDCLNLYERMNQAWYEDYVKLLNEHTDLKKKIQMDLPVEIKSEPDYFFDNYGNRYTSREEAIEAIKNFRD